METLVVTASNDAYLPLFRGLLMSLKQFGNPLPFAAIGCLDVGLSEANRKWIASEVSHLVEAEWDLPVSQETREGSAHLRAMTARPLLPRYFPGYDRCIWIDSDAWVQEKSVFDYLLAASEGGALAIVPEVDRAYRQAIANPWRVNRLARYYGDGAPTRLFNEGYFNSGVFALRADAPHWEQWAEHLRQGLVATNGTLVCDQTALNHAIWTEALPVHPLPAVCNWLCHPALPNFDPARKRFHEPCVPHDVWASCIWPPIRKTRDSS